MLDYVALALLIVIVALVVAWPRFGHSLRDGKEPGSSAPGCARRGDLGEPIHAEQP
jgi:hypothetical protein